MSIGDMQQINVAAADAEAANLADPLNGELLAPTDGKKITADNYGTGKAPINPAVKRLAQRTAGVIGWIVGNITGIKPRSLKRLWVDASGGTDASAIPAGQARADTVRADTYVTALAGSDSNTLFPTLLSMDVAADGKVDIHPDRFIFTRTSAGIQNPASSAPIKNELRPILITKAHGLIMTDGIGGISVQDGANIASAAIVGTDIRVTFASAMDNTSYTALRSADAAGVPIPVSVTDRKAAYVQLNVIGVNPLAAAVRIDLSVMGRQTTP